MYRLLVIIFVICQGFCAAAATTWDGSESSDWDDPDNWSDGVPDADDDVTIPDCSSFNFCPVIDGTTTALTKKLDIDGSLTVESGGSITTDGDLTIDSGGTMQAGGSIVIDGESVMDGTLTIESGGTINATDDFLVGENNNTATFTNNGTATFDAKIKAEPPGGSFGDGPFIINNSTMTIDSEFNIGNGDGAGYLTNSGTITANKAHIDGNLCNSGSITATAEFKNHGGLVACGGSIETASVVMQQNGTRAGTFGSQTVTDGSTDCANGVDGSGPTFEIKGETTYSDFETFLENNGDSPTGDAFDFSNPGFSTCGENAAQALPVELLFFKGSSISDQVELTWSTATEIDNDRFEIEKSSDGIRFVKIDEVAGHGDSNEVINYSYLDENVHGHQNYYRLKQVDYDGKFEYFNTIMVLSTGSSGIKIYPNPVRNQLIKVQVDNLFRENLIAVELADFSGKTLQRKAGYYQKFELSTDGLQRGTYFVRVNSNGAIKVSKVLVE